MLWSTGFIAAKYALPFIEPFNLLFIRMTLTESHSIFFLVVGSLATAWLLQRFLFKGKMIFAVACWGAFLIYCTHILIDTFTVYGTQLLAPLSRKGYALGNLFIIDPLFTLPLLAGVFYVCFGKRSRHARVNMAMLVLTILYKAWSLTVQFAADTKLRDATAEAGYEVTRHLTSAGLFTTFLWRHLAEIPNGHILGYWSIFDADDKNITFLFIPKSKEKTVALRDSRSFAVIEWFSQGWWCVMPSGGETIRVVDLRFTEIPSSRHGSHIYWNWPFSWDFLLAQNKETPLQPVVPGMENLSQTPGLLVRRIAGGSGWLNGDEEIQAL